MNQVKKSWIPLFTFLLMIVPQRRRNMVMLSLEHSCFLDVTNSRKESCHNVFISLCKANMHITATKVALMTEDSGSDLVARSFRAKNTRSLTYRAQKLYETIWEESGF